MVERHFGWKPSPPDYRDRNYAFVAPGDLVRSLPTSYDTFALMPQQPPLFPCLDQGALGSCGPSSLAEMLLVAQFKAGITVGVLPSILQIYYATRMLMGTVGQDSGVDNRTLLKAVATYGWALGTLWPYQISKFKTNPPKAVWDDAVTRKINQYQAVAQTVTDIKAAVYSMTPVLFGFTVYTSMLSNSVAQTGTVPMPQPGDKVEGGHDVTIYGWDDNRQVFLFRNHWYNAPNQPWGNKGNGTIPYAYATDSGLSGDFWTVLAPGMTPPAPPTPPTPTTTTFVLNNPLAAGTYTLTRIALDSTQTYTPPLKKKRKAVR